MEGFTQFENPPTKDEVITILRDRGIDDPEAKRILLSYDDIGRAAADALEQTEGTPEARLGHAFDMAKIYFEAGYKEYATESLEELLQTDLSENLRQEIEEELDRMLDSE